MKSRLLILAVVAIIAAASIAAFILTSRGDEEPNPDEQAVTEFAPVRAYAGFTIDRQGFDGSGSPAVVARVGSGSPAEQAGLGQSDVVAQIAGVTVNDAHEVYSEIEKRRPGESIDIEVHRYDFRLVASNRPLPEPEKLTLTVALVEEPLDAGIFWLPSTAMNYEDQIRLGLFLSEITLPLAQHFGIDEPGGALVRQRLPTWFDKGTLDGDVIKSFDGKPVTSVGQLQRLVDQAPEGKPITIGVRRGGQDLKFTLDALGPNVPCANHLPAQARKRLQAAIESGGLHPQHLQALGSSYRGRDPTPGESTVRARTIKKLSDSAITIEMYDTGGKWTLSISPSTNVAVRGAPNGLADLSVGDFVEMFSSADAARNIISKSAPLRP
jgi:membrane-associated protease RseP (regulator of RpoE activity)